RVEVLPETRELTVDEARTKYSHDSSIPWLPAPADVVMLDHLPELPEHRMLDSYAEWFAGVLAWFSQTASPLQVGIHEIRPGVWTGLRTHIAPSAQLCAPCWLGENVQVGPNTIIG